MRNILLLFISLLFVGLWSCSDDEGGVIVNLPSEAFSFKPIAGGAIMHYLLPDDPDIVGIKVRYKDTYGNDILRVGSSVGDSLKLIGFNEAATNVPAQITLHYFNDLESQPIDVTFTTKDSGPVSFLKNAQVFSNWGGFTVKFENPEETSGIAHVFYLGTDPVTNLPDTVLISSFLLQETDGVEAINYKMQQDVENPTVVIRAEDFRGYMVGENVWEKVATLVMEKLTPNNFSFFCNNSVEDTNDKLGVQYLFDGDTKGLICFEPGNREKCCSFLAGPNAAGENAHPMYLDLKKNRVLASVRIYHQLYHEAGTNWYTGTSDYICYYFNENEMPNEVTLYGLKDNGSTPSNYDVFNSMDGWEEIGKFKQDKLINYKERWCYHAWATYNWMPFSKMELEAADDEYMDITVPADGQEDGYRYLKMVINDVFDMWEDYGSRNFYNLQKYVQFHELEVYTDKD